MTDLFGEWVPDEMIDRVFAVMALSPQHTFQVLTKRPERMREYVSEECFGAAERVWGEWDNIVGGPIAAEWPGWPLPNVWLGVSAENQEQADERIPELLNTPAAVRWLSCEPLLEPVDLASHKAIEADGTFTGWRIPHGIDWAVVGGESGSGARACHVGWIRSIVRQGQVARVPVFVKQGSGPRPGMPTGDPELDGLKEYPNGHA
jgi:protein gp37